MNMSPASEIARIQRSAIYVVVGVLCVAIVMMGFLFDRSLDQQKLKYDRVIDVVRQQQFDSCVRGNQIRRQLARDNEITIKSLRELIRTDSAREKEVHRDTLRERLDRRAELQEYPCRELLVASRLVFSPLEE